jgi:hypothetical protein
MAKFAEPVVVEEKTADLAMELERPGYLRPEPKPEEREKGTRTPIYTEILRGAKWLGGLAMFVRMVGVFWMLVALCLVAVPLIPWVREIMPLEEWPIGWFVSGAVLMVMAFGCMLCGATVSMMSGLALAVRDMARNSFSEEKDSASRVVVSNLVGSDLRQLPAIAIVE